MNNMNKKWPSKTYIKYFSSYLLIVTILILAFFFIIKKQLMDRSMLQYKEQVQTQLTNCREQLIADVSHLTQVNNSLMNHEVFTSAHPAEYPQKYYTHQTLKQYNTCTQLVKSIVYKHKNSSDIMSTQYYITYEDGVFLIDNHHLGTMTFDPNPWLNYYSGQLIYVSNNITNELIYLPPYSNLDSSFLFFLLNSTNIQQQLKNICSDKVIAVALLDENRQLAVEVNGSQLTPYMQTFDLKSGIYELNDSTAICVSDDIANNFHLVALISMNSFSTQINFSFASSYLSLLALGGLGLFLVLLAMQKTFVPLEKLILKVIPNANPKQNYLIQLESAFLQNAEQIQTLQEKLNYYRISMQKSLLGSIIDSCSARTLKEYPDIDVLFDTRFEKEIFVLQVMSPEGPLSYIDILEYFQNMLPGKEPCQLLEIKPASTTFLINYIGSEPNKDSILIELLNQLHEENGYLSALSNGTESPLDIPSLYENAIYASGFWSQTPVVAFRDLPPTTPVFIYPYPKIDHFSLSLREKNFSVSHTFADELFEIANHSNQADNNLPNFFLRCILIDILTAIANCMNQYNIKFETYSSLYTETLFLCRSCSYQEKAELIKGNIHRLIDFFQKELDNMILTPVQVIRLMEENYSDPDFSIALLADKCKVSIAYMSYLIKKELNQNFSDYLWSLRLQKAQELLNDSDLSINEISIKVGYLNATSFRRKFKQETGFTPSEFRTYHKCRD